MYKRCLSIRSCSQTKPGIFSKEVQESLSALLLDCRCKARASSRSCLINPNWTRNLSLLLPWVVTARQAWLPGQLAYPFTGPFCYFCFPGPVGALFLLLFFSLLLSTFQVSTFFRSFWLFTYLLFTFLLFYFSTFYPSSFLLFYFSTFLLL